MVKKRILSTKWILILLVVLHSGCNVHTSIAPMPDIGVSENEMNTQIHLETPSAINTFRIGEPISISVDVTSTHQIAFPFDNIVRIFVLKEKQWVEVPNLTKYPQGYLVLSPSKDSQLNTGVVPIFPVLSETNKEVLVRIILIGYIYRERKVTDEQTMAYIDVKLKP